MSDLCGWIGRALIYVFECYRYYRFQLGSGVVQSQIEFCSPRNSDVKQIIIILADLLCTLFFSAK